MGQESLNNKYLTGIHDMTDKKVTLETLEEDIAYVEDKFLGQQSIIHSDMLQLWKNVADLEKQVKTLRREIKLLKKTTYTM
jgi:hypothetical protein